MSAAYRKKLWGLISQPPYNTMSDQECLNAINAKTQTKIVSKRLTERDLLLLFPSLSAGEAFLAKLESGADSNMVLKRALRWFLPSENGIDVGHVKTRAMLDALVGQFGVTQTEVDTLKNSAVQNVSPAELAGLAVVKLGDIITTRQIYS